MEFMMSSESDGRYDDFADALRETRNEIARDVKEFLKDRDYGSEVVDLGVIPIIMKFDDEMERQGWFKERVYLKRREADADVRLRIDYDRFVKGDKATKRLLLIDNIIQSIRALSSKANKDFRAGELEQDILALLDVRIEELDHAAGRV
jgi:hypothetical protein